MELIAKLYNYVLNEEIVGLQSIQLIFSFLYLLFDKNKSVSVNDNDNDTIISKIKNIYATYGFEYNEKFDKIIIQFIKTVKETDNKMDRDTMLDKLFLYYLRNENLSVVKDYSKYYNRTELTNWILKLAKLRVDKNNEYILVGNMKIHSYFDMIIEKSIKNNIDINTISKYLYGYQQNIQVKNLEIMNLLMKFNYDFDKNISSNDLLSDDINAPIKSFDLIIFDFPAGIHNIVHAHCCNKIKKLKLRGTKSEPLLLQLILQSLNKNGRALLIVPDSLLFSDSLQPIETRKYLMENFNVKKIIQIDESLYINKNIKQSILYFENNGSTTSVDFSNIKLRGETIDETQVITIDINKIKSNFHSLYWKNYETINISNEDMNEVSFNELFEIKNINDKILNQPVICLEKYYKNDNSILFSFSKLDNYENYIVSQHTEPTNFNLKLLAYILKTKYLNLVKGKMNQFDLLKIKELRIPQVNESVKKSVCDYIDLTNQLITDNDNKIEQINKLKMCFINSIQPTNYIELNKICELINKNNIEEQNNKMVGIIRNGLSAGKVYTTINEKLLNNSHYLKIVNTNYLIDYIYHYLKYSESKLIDFAFLNPQPNLSQTNLLNFKIPELSIEKQSDIISQCNDFDNIITKYEYNKRILMEKDIISTIIKFNVLL